MVVEAVANERGLAGAGEDHEQPSAPMQWPPRSPSRSVAAFLCLQSKPQSKEQSKDQSKDQLQVQVQERAETSTMTQRTTADAMTAKPNRGDGTQEPPSLHPERPNNSDRRVAASLISNSLSLPSFDCLEVMESSVPSFALMASPTATMPSSRSPFLVQDPHSPESMTSIMISPMDSLFQSPAIDPFSCDQDRMDHPAADVGTKASLPAISDAPTTGMTCALSPTPSPTAAAATANTPSSLSAVSAMAALDAETLGSPSQPHPACDVLPQSPTLLLAQSPTFSGHDGQTTGSISESNADAAGTFIIFDDHLMNTSFDACDSPCGDNLPSSRRSPNADYRSRAPIETNEEIAEFVTIAPSCNLAPDNHGQSSQTCTSEKTQAPAFATASATVTAAADQDESRDGARMVSPNDCLPADQTDAFCPAADTINCGVLDRSLTTIQDAAQDKSEAQRDESASSDRPAVPSPAKFMFSFFPVESMDDGHDGVIPIDLTSNASDTELLHPDNFLPLCTDSSFPPTNGAADGRMSLGDPSAARHAGSLQPSNEGLPCSTMPASAHGRAPCDFAGRLDRGMMSAAFQSSSTSLHRTTANTACGPTLGTKGITGADHRAPHGLGHEFDQWSESACAAAAIAAATDVLQSSNNHFVNGPVLATEPSPSTAAEMYERYRSDYYGVAEWKTQNGHGRTGHHGQRQRFHPLYQLMPNLSGGMTTAPPTHMGAAGPQRVLPPTTFGRLGAAPQNTRYGDSNSYSRFHNCDHGAQYNLPYDQMDQYQHQLLQQSFPHPPRHPKNPSMPLMHPSSGTRLLPTQRGAIHAEPAVGAKALHRKDPVLNTHIANPHLNGMIGGCRNSEGKREDLAVCVQPLLKTGDSHRGSCNAMTGKAPPGPPGHPPLLNRSESNRSASHATGAIGLMRPNHAMKRKSETDVADLADMMVQYASRATSSSSLPSSVQGRLRGAPSFKRCRSDDRVLSQRRVETTAPLQSLAMVMAMAGPGAEVDRRAVAAPPRQLPLLPPPALLHTAASSSAAADTAADTAAAPSTAVPVAAAAAIPASPARTARPQSRTTILATPPRPRWRDESTGMDSSKSVVTPSPKPARRPPASPGLPYVNGNGDGHADGKAAAGYKSPALRVIKFDPPAKKDDAAPIGRSNRAVASERPASIGVPRRLFCDELAKPPKPQAKPTKSGRTKAVSKKKPAKQVRKRQASKKSRGGTKRGNRIAGGSGGSESAPQTVDPCYLQKLERLSADMLQFKATFLETSARKKAEEEWSVGFECLVAFAKKNGHARVSCPASSSRPKNQKFLTWVKRQRYLFKNFASDMPPQHIAALDSIGFTWSVPSRSWEAKYKQLVAHYEVHGQGAHVERGDTAELSKWAKDQRRRYRCFMKGEKSGMTMHRIERLNAIGFPWATTTTAAQWDDNQIPKSRPPSAISMAPSAKASATSSATSANVGIVSGLVPSARARRAGVGCGIQQRKAAPKIAASACAALDQRVRSSAHHHQAIGDMRAYVPQGGSVFDRHPGRFTACQTTTLQHGGQLIGSPDWTLSPEPEFLSHAGWPASLDAMLPREGAAGAANNPPLANGTSAGWQGNLANAAAAHPQHGSGDAMR